MSNADDYVNRYRRRVVPSGTTLLCAEEERLDLEFRNQERLVDFVNDMRKAAPGTDPFSLQTIRRLHAITVEDIYPSGGNVRGPGEEVEIPGATFVPVPGEIALSDLQVLVDHINEVAEHPASPEELIAEVAGAFHRFLQIHPFLDGNGRVGRGLLHLMLYEFNLLTPPEHIYDFLEAHRKSYFYVLSSADSHDQNLGPSALYSFISEAVADVSRQRIMDNIMSGPLARYIAQELPGRSLRLMDRDNRWKIPWAARRSRMKDVADEISNVLDRISKSRG